MSVDAKMAGLPALSKWLISNGLDQLDEMAALTACGIWFDTIDDMCASSAFLTFDSHTHGRHRRALMRGIALSGKLSKVAEFQVARIGSFDIDAAAVYECIMQGKYDLMLHLLSTGVVPLSAETALVIYEAALQVGAIALLQHVTDVFPIAHCKFAQGWYTLAAQCPESSSLQWIHDRGVPLPGQGVFGTPVVHRFKRSAVAWLIERGMVPPSNMISAILVAALQTTLPTVLDPSLLRYLYEIGYRPSLLDIDRLMQIARRAQAIRALREDRFELTFEFSKYRQPMDITCQVGAEMRALARQWQEPCQ